MRIQVKLYATLSHYSPEGGPAGTPFMVEMEDGARIQELIERLSIPPEETKLAFVNGISQELEWPLAQGDQVGIFPPIGGGSVGEIGIDTWLYGDLARYGREANQGSFANLLVRLPEGSTVGDLLAFLEMPSEARGITFISGELSAMPGSQPDLDQVLNDGDRVAFFHPLSMWPFQYRFGVAMAPGMAKTLQSSDDGGLHHSYEDPSEEEA